MRINRQRRTYLFPTEDGGINAFSYNGVEEAMVLPSGHQVVLDHENNYFLVENNWLAIDILFEKEKYTKEEGLEFYALTFEIKVSNRVIKFKVDKVIKISPTDAESLVHLIREDGSVVLLPAGSRLIDKKVVVEEV